MSESTLAPAIVRKSRRSWRAPAFIALCAALAVSGIANAVQYGAAALSANDIDALSRRYIQLKESRSQLDYLNMRQEWRLSALTGWQSEKLFASEDAREAFTACLRHPNGQIFAWKEVVLAWGRLRAGHNTPGATARGYATNAAGTSFAPGEACYLADATLVQVHATTEDGFRLSTVRYEDDGRVPTCPLGVYELVIPDGVDVQRVMIEHCFQEASREVVPSYRR